MRILGMFGVMGGTFAGLASLDYLWSGLVKEQTRKWLKIDQDRQKQREALKQQDKTKENED